MAHANWCLELNAWGAWALEATQKKKKLLWQKICWSFTLRWQKMFLNKFVGWSFLRKAYVFKKGKGSFWTIKVVRDLLKLFPSIKITKRLKGLKIITFWVILKLLKQKIWSLKTKIWHEIMKNERIISLKWSKTGSKTPRFCSRMTCSLF